MRRNITIVTSSIDNKYLRRFVCSHTDAETVKALGDPCLGGWEDFCLENYMKQNFQEEPEDSMLKLKEARVLFISLRSLLSFLTAPFPNLHETLHGWTQSVLAVRYLSR